MMVVVLVIRLCKFVVILWFILNGVILLCDLKKL